MDGPNFIVEHLGPEALGGTHFPASLNIGLCPSMKNPRLCRGFPLISEVDSIVLPAQTHSQHFCGLSHSCLESQLILFCQSRNPTRTLAHVVDTFLLIYYICHYYQIALCYLRRARMEKPNNMLPYHRLQLLNRLPQLQRFAVYHRSVFVRMRSTNIPFRRIEQRPDSVFHNTIGAQRKKYCLRAKLYLDSDYKNIFVCYSNDCRLDI